MCPLAPVSAAPAPTVNEAAEVDRLIANLANADFAEREKAQQTLDAIGSRALEALQKAAKSDDPEVRRRAEELVGKIQVRAATDKVLATRTFQLICNDTPVAEAVARLAKESGVDVVLHDPNGNLKDRLVTLDTGETTFWKTLDQLCVKAGLIEKQSEQVPVRAPFAAPPGQPGAIGPAPKPAIRIIRKAVPAPVPAVEPILPEIEAPPAKPVPPPVKPKPAAQAVPGAVRQPVAAAVEVPVAPIAAPPALKPIAPAILPTGLPVAVSSNRRITLADGKPISLPAFYPGALRIRCATKQEAPPSADGSAISVGLIASLEPRLHWNEAPTLRIEKALDDHGQPLTVLTMPTPAPAVGKGAAIARVMPVVSSFDMHQLLTIHLKKGEHASKALRELSGTLSANLASAPEPLITVDKVLEAGGKTFKGKDGGRIKIVDVKKLGNGDYQVQAELQLPAGGQAGQGRIRIGGAIQIMPLPAVPAVPALPPGAFQAQAPAKRVQAPPPVPAPPVQAVPIQVQAQAIQIQGPIQIQIGGPGQAQVIWGGGFGMNTDLSKLALLDDKGNALLLVGTGFQVKQGPAGVQQSTTLTYRPQPGQGAPSKLVYTGSREMKIEVPFTLKSVPMP